MSASLSQSWLRSHVRIEETVDGRFMVLVNGFQWGGVVDRSGAGNATFATRDEALTAYQQAREKE